MTPAQLLARFRSELRDTAEPYLWSDDDVRAYMADAEAMFCRLTDGIADATTPDVVDIAVAASAEWLDLHPSILKIRSAHRTSDGKPLTLLNAEDLEGRGMRFDGTTGELSILVTGMEENQLRCNPIPADADAIKLMVFRKPLATAFTGAVDEVFEIASEHHLHLIKWMKHLAHLKEDSETFNAAKSEEYAAAFAAYCSQAQREQQKKRHKGVRTVAYGGI